MSDGAPTTRRPIDTPDESVLIEALKSGDDAAFETLVRGHTGWMLRVARRLLADDNDAQDAVQDAFISAFKSIERFDGRARLSTWLHRIVTNAALMKLRSKKRRPERTIEDLLPRFHDDGHRVNPRQAWSPPVEDLLEKRETRDLILHQIDELPPDYRTVLVMRDIEQLDTQQTADMLEISTAAVKTRLHRARQALRELLEGRSMTNAPKMTCRELIEFLDDYVDDSVDPEVRVSFDQHVSTCPSCRDYIDTYRQTLRMTESLCEELNGPIPEAVPEELIQAILAARKKG